MPITFTASGYIEVLKDDQLISKHRAEREAIESCARQGAGTYVLTYPDVIVKIDGGAGVINGSLTV